MALSLILLSLYHAWIRKTAILASVIIPALIMVLYTAWVLYSAKRDKYRRNLAVSTGTCLLNTRATSSCANGCTVWTGETSSSVAGVGGFSLMMWEVMGSMLSLGKWF